MPPDSDIAAVAALLADPSRAAMMVALLDGRALAAGELARIAAVSAQTASAHLSKLLAGGLVRLTAQGRHRYYAIANGEIAHAIETLSVIAPPAKIRSLRQSLQMQQLSSARTCYDHLAGRLAVGIADSLVERGDCERLESGFAIATSGIAFLATLGIDAASLCKGTPPIAKSCIDWTERRQHLGGPVGKALLHAMIDRQWLERSAQPRLLRVTQAGRRSLRRHFNLDV